MTGWFDVQVREKLLRVEEVHSREFLTESTFLILLSLSLGLVQTDFKFLASGWCLLVLVLLAG